MTLGERIRALRENADLSQEAIGAQGFISAPGWIKIENNQRQPSEKLIEQLVAWLSKDKHIKANSAKALREELTTLKYMGSNSPFLRILAKEHAKTLPNAAELLTETVPVKRRRGRPLKRVK